MKILIVASGNNQQGQAAPFIREQAESLQSVGHEIEYFLIQGKGWRSYLRHIKLLRNFLRDRHYDLVHAHFIWSCLVAVMQRKVPVVATFHGCDLNRKDLRMISRLVVYPLAAFCIVVNEKMLKFLPSGKTAFIPCGIDAERFQPVEHDIACAKLNLSERKKYVLFCSTFDRVEKNAVLAKKAVSFLNNDNVVLLEFTGYDREQSALLYSAVDLVLMTSIREGSPMVIKEAMAANCPIVTTDVGDVRWVLGDTKNCHICTFDADEILQKMNMILSSEETRADGRERIFQLHLTLADSAAKIDRIYHKVVA